MIYPPPLSREMLAGSIDISAGMRLVQPPVSVVDPGIVQGLRMSSEGIPVRFVAAESPEEGYELLVQSEGINIRTGSEPGALHALRTLTSVAESIPPGRSLPCQRIVDQPDLTFRAFHLDLKDQMLSFHYILRLVDRLAAMRYNTLLIEYEDKFPYSEDILPLHPEALSEQQVSGLIEYCRKRGIQVVPKVPCLGHLEFLLYHRPDLAETGAGYQVCPLKEEALDVILRMIDEVLDLHPYSGLFHVGGDETWYLGRCAECSRASAEDGLGGLYGKFMERVTHHVLSNGRRPMMWADMVLGHPDALPFIDSETLMVDWQYSYYDEEVDYAIAWGEGGRTPTEEWSDLPGDFRRRYSDYVRPDRESPWCEGFSYTEYLREQGYDVVTAPAVRSAGDPHTHPDWKKHLPNVTAAARVASEDGALGCLVTSWAVRRVIPGLTMMGAAAAAWAMWRPASAGGGWLLEFPSLYGRDVLGRAALGQAAWEMSCPGLGYDMAVPRERSADGMYFQNPRWQKRLRDRMPDFPSIPPSVAGEMSGRIMTADRVLNIFDRAVREGNGREEVLLYRLAAEEMLAGLWSVRLGARLRQQPGDSEALGIARRLKSQLERLREHCNEVWADMLHPASLEREIRMRFGDLMDILGAV